MYKRRLSGTQTCSREAEEAAKVKLSAAHSCERKSTRAFAVNKHNTVAIKYMHI